MLLDLEIYSPVSINVILKFLLQMNHFFLENSWQKVFRVNILLSHKKAGNFSLAMNLFKFLRSSRFFFSFFYTRYCEIFLSILVGNFADFLSILVENFADFLRIFLSTFIIYRKIFIRDFTQNRSFSIFLWWQWILWVIWINYRDLDFLFT